MKTKLLTLLLVVSAPCYAQVSTTPFAYPAPSTTPSSASSSSASSTLNVANQAQIQQAQMEQAQQDQIQQTEYPGGPAASASDVPPLVQGPAIPGAGNAQINNPSTAQAPQPPKRPPAESLSEEEKLLWMIDPKQTARQQGQRIEQPLSKGLYHSASLSDKELLRAWTYHLMNEGVPEAKILFEAKRLNKHDFERWASRFVWWEESLHPNVVRQHP